MTSAALEKIITRGYWKVVLRPLVFRQNRISTLWDCEKLVSNCKVVGGWDYPHCEKVQSGIDYVWSEVDWEEHKEFWRFYQSGQFVHYFACIEDWWRESKLSDAAMRPYVSGEALDSVYALLRMTEIYEFAARLGAKGIFDNYLDMHTELHGALNRNLVAVNRNWDLSEHRCAMVDLEFDSQFHTQDLIQEKHQLALENTLWVLERFDWRDVRKPETVTNLAKEQEKLLEGM
jgi:hypothetical protein